MIRDRLMTVLWMGVGAGVAMMVAGSAQTSKTDVIEAQRIILRDDRGTPRLYLIADDEGNSPWISLHDKEGDRRLVLWLAAGERPEVKLYGKTGPPLAGLTLNAYELPAIFMGGTNSSLDMGVGKEGVPYIRLYGKGPEIWLDDHYTEASKIISLGDEPIPTEAKP